VTSSFDLATALEDHIAAFDHHCDEKFMDFQKRVVQEKEEVIVEVEVHTEKTALEAWNRNNMVKKGVWCICKCHHGAKDKQSDLERG
jgi:ABC-type uncharacterized transport system ATPase component